MTSSSRVMLEIPGLCAPVEHSSQDIIAAGSAESPPDGSLGEPVHQMRRDLHSRSFVSLKVASWRVSCEAFRAYVRVLLKGAATALRSRAKFGCMLQALAIAILVCFFTVPAIHAAFIAVGDFKADNGFLFSAVTTAVFGGTLPYLFLTAINSWSARTTTLSASDQLQHTPNSIEEGSPSQQQYTPYPAWTKSVWLHALFFTAFWGYKGVEIDAFYRLQSIIYGSTASFTTIVKKVLTDQFVYCPVWAVFSSIIPYRWEQENFSFRKTWDSLDRNFFLYTYPTTLISAWMVWIPVVSVVYAMPSALQVPLFIVANSFWALLLGMLSSKDTDSTNQL